MNFEFLETENYPALGMFNLSTEEKIATGIVDKYHPLGVLTEFDKSQLVSMVKPLLGMYQEAVLTGIIPVLDDNDMESVEVVQDYLFERSQLPITIIKAFTSTLWDLTQAGALELKHMDPTEKKTSAITTKVLPSIEEVKTFTPKLVSSLWELDLPEFLSKNLLTLALAGTALAAFTLMKGGQGGRTT